MRCLITSSRNIPNSAVRWKTKKALTDDMKQEILRIAEAFRTANAERFRKE